MLPFVARCSSLGTDNGQRSIPLCTPSASPGWLAPANNVTSVSACPIPRRSVPWSVAPYPDVTTQLKSLESAVLVFASHPPLPQQGSDAHTQPQEVCWNWNTGRCYVNQCQYHHVCRVCGGPKPAMACCDRSLGPTPMPQFGQAPSSENWVIDAWVQVFISAYSLHIRTGLSHTPNREQDHTDLPPCHTRTGSQISAWCSMLNGSLTLLLRFRYRYTKDLLALDQCRAPRTRLPSSQFAGVVTPLQGDRWQESLSGHPDREFATYIVQGIRFGFRISFRYGSISFRSVQKNMPSVQQCRDKISTFLATECAAGRDVGQSLCQ